MQTVRNRPRKGEKGRNPLGAFEPLLTMGSSMVAEPLSGLAGIAALPFGAKASANAISGVQDSLTYQPKTDEGKEALQRLGQTLAPVGEAFTGASEFLGDNAYDLTGSPTLAAAAYSIPTLALEAIGLKSARSINTGKPLQFGDIGTQSSKVGGRQKGEIGGVRAKKAAEELERRGVSASPLSSDEVMVTHSGGEITEIEKGGVFNGLFTVDGPESFSGTGLEGKQTTFAINRENIASSGDADLDYKSSIAFLKKKYPDADDEVIDILYEWVAEDNSTPWDNNVLEPFGFDDAGEASWHAQRLRGELAIDQGFDAIDMSDETGTSTLIPFGSKARIIKRDY